MDKEDIDRRAIEFVKDQLGPLGPRPLEKVLRQHIGLLTDLRDAGASWRQIAALMARHGVKRKDGGVVDATQWAAMVSRAVRDAKPSGDQNAPAKSTPPQITAKLAAPSMTPQSTHAPSHDRQTVRERMRSSQAIREE